MNKEIKKAAALLQEKETKRAESLAKIDAEIKSTRETIEIISGKLEKAEDAEQFKRLLSDKRDNEAALEFFEQKRAEASTATLTADEYKAIKANCKKSFDDMKATTATDIKAEIEKINKMIEAFNANTDELNEVMKQAAKLKGDNMPMLFNSTNLSDDFQIREFLGTYFRMKAAQARGIQL